MSELLEKIKTIKTEEELNEFIDNLLVERRREQMRDYQNEYYRKHADKLNEKQKERYKKRTENTEKKKAGRPRKYPIKE